MVAGNSTTADGAANSDDAGENGFIVSQWPVTTAWLCFVLVSLQTARNLHQHLANYSRPDLQAHVLRIILVGPIYSVSAALCLSMTTESACFFVSAVRDVWEAVVIYSFLTLVIEYMGGEHLCLHSISQREEAVPHLFPLNWCLPPIPTAWMIRGPKIGALQFVAVKPIVATVSIVFYACGLYKEAFYQWTLVVVYNISYTVALYALYLIYWASHEHHSLLSKRPLLKFLSVKMIVFLTFWQALFLPLAPLPGGSTKRWEDFILSVEMAFFNVLMNKAFSWKEFHSGLRSSGVSGTAGMPGVGKPVRFEDGDLIDLGDGLPVGQSREASAKEPLPPVPAVVPNAALNGSNGRSRLGSGELLQNAKAAFYPKDVLEDASRNFSRRYQQHVLIESAQEYELQNVEPAPPALDLLDANNGQPRSMVAQARDGLAKKTFRARTYLVGRSLTEQGAEENEGSQEHTSQQPAGEAAPVADPIDLGCLPEAATIGAPCPAATSGTDAAAGGGSGEPQLEPDISAFPVFMGGESPG